MWIDLGYKMVNLDDVAAIRFYSGPTVGEVYLFWREEGYDRVEVENHNLELVKLEIVEALKKGNVTYLDLYDYVKKEDNSE